MSIKVIQFLTLIMFPIISVAQVKVEGTIYDSEDNSFIPYVNIYHAKDYKNGLVSSPYGGFSIELSIEHGELEFSHISYETMRFDIKELLSHKDSIKIFLKPKDYLIDAVEVKPKDYSERLKMIIRKFDTSFRGGYALASCILSNTSKYDNKYMSFFESAGFMYYSRSQKNDDMIFLPFNTRASNVVYPKTGDYKKIESYEKYYNFSWFKKDFCLFEELGPLNSKNLNLYSYFHDTQQSTEQKLVFTFKTNKKAKFRCNGSIQVDLENNIVDWVKISSIYSKKQLKLIENMGVADRSNKLEIYYQHKNNQIHYKKLVSKIDWHLVYQGLKNELYVEFYDFPYGLENPLYKAPGNRTSSTMMLYEASLVRIYYDEIFWASVKKSKYLDARIREDLEVEGPLEEQFKNNHLKYAPELDSKRFSILDSLFMHGNYSHKIYTNDKVIQNSDYLSRYKITDSYVRPFIMEMNNKIDKAWTK